MTYPLVKFGDVVRQVKDKVDPQTAGLDRYVAGEHMDTDNLHIRRWGLIGDDYLGPAFHMRFKPGQILYGSRRTYLRKVAVADFEGITANTTYVLEPKDPEVLLPDFLPFVMSTERFHEHSIKQSKGSVNPYINFSDITWYEFPLPPVDEQRRIANLLWAADDAVDENLELEKSLQVLLSSQLVENFVNIPKKFPKDWKAVDLQDLCDKPIVYGIVQAYENIENGIPYVRVVDMVNGRLSLDEMLRTTFEIDHAYRRARIETNDIVFALRGEIGNVLMVPQELDGINISRGVARLSLIDGLENYVLWAIRSPYVKSQITKVSTGSTFKEIKIGSLRKIKIPIPTDRNGVIAITDTLNNIQSTLDVLANHIKVSKELKSKYMNQSLG